MTKRERERERKSDSLVYVTRSSRRLLGGYHFIRRPRFSDDAFVLNRGTVFPRCLASSLRLLYPLLFRTCATCVRSTRIKFASCHRRLLRREIRVETRPPAARVGNIYVNKAVPLRASVG